MGKGGRMRLESVEVLVDAGCCAARGVPNEVNLCMHDSICLAALLLYVLHLEAVEAPTKTPQPPRPARHWAPLSARRCAALARTTMRSPPPRRFPARGDPGRARLPQRRRGVHRQRRGRPPRRARGAPHRLRSTPVGAGTPPLPTVLVAGPCPARVPRRPPAATAAAVTAGGAPPPCLRHRSAHTAVCAIGGTAHSVGGHRGEGEREARRGGVAGGGSGDGGSHPGNPSCHHGNVRYMRGEPQAEMRPACGGGPGAPVVPSPAGDRRSGGQPCPPGTPPSPLLPDARRRATTSRSSCRPRHRRRPHRWRPRRRGPLPHRRQRGILCAAGPHPPSPAASTLASGRCGVLRAATDSIARWKSYRARQGRWQSR